MVVTHNPYNPPLKQWIAELQRDVINPNDWMRRVLPEPPLIAERNWRSTSCPRDFLLHLMLLLEISSVTDQNVWYVSSIWWKQEVSEVREQARCSRSDTRWLAIPPISCTFSIATHADTPNTLGKQRTVWGPGFTNTGPISTQTQALMSPDISTHRTTHLQTWNVLQ